MNKFHIRLIIGVALLATLIQATPTEQFKRSKRTKRSILQALFGSTTSSTEPPTTTPDRDVVMESLENGEPVYLMKPKQDSDGPPAFVPMMPLRYFASPSGLHFIAVEPINFNDENEYIQQEGAEQQWQPNYIPVPVKNLPKGVHKKLPSQLQGLSSSEIRELSSLAKKIGVRNLDDLPPLEEVMSLLGTTTKSETIEAIRDYASTPTGLDLIKDYILSYQPVKRMDIVGADGEVANEKIPIESLDAYAAGGELMYVNYPVPIIGYTVPNGLNNNQIEGTNPTTEEPSSPGIFSRIRSFFSFGSNPELPEQEPNTNLLANNQSELNLIPHIVIPLRHWSPTDDSSGYTVEDMQRYPITPLQQDKIPYVMKPEPDQISISNAPVSDAMNPVLNQAQIYHDDIDVVDIKDNVPIAIQQPVRISLPEEQTGKLHKVHINNADLPPTINKAEQKQLEVITTKPTVVASTTKNIANETKVPQITPITKVQNTTSNKTTVPKASETSQEQGNGLT
ncbi:uncharacterized protein LOC5569025 [Aedes aegypti]|uniref:Uncharacterized protein n=1 Tax=Aedes aegypti TaxID=7159 RepID=A0A1S4FG36_AEDAE|nr:uncharacterized protein LOC5569025 [Aedes aegypti]